MKTFKLCYDVLYDLETEPINYTYKDGYYHTRLCLADSKPVISGFEDKLAFVTSLAFANFLTAHTIKVLDLENWDNIIEKFVKSEEYNVLLTTLRNRPYITKGLKILKPYSKKQVISCMDVLNSYMALLEKHDSLNLYTLFYSIFGCDLLDFLIYDDVEIIMTDTTKISNKKFKNKHKRIKSLWD